MVLLLALAFGTKLALDLLPDALMLYFFLLFLPFLPLAIPATSGDAPGLLLLAACLLVVSTLVRRSSKFGGRRCGIIQRE